VTEKETELQWIIITLDSGYIIPLGFVTKTRGIARPPVPEAIDAEIKKSGWHNIVSWRYVRPEEATHDRDFRDAWRDDGTKIVIDMPAARVCWRNKIREARAAKLSELDWEYLYADERGDVAKKESIAKQKQALRDAPTDPAIKEAKTPEELKAVWPEMLR